MPRCEGGPTTLIGLTASATKATDMPLELALLAESMDVEAAARDWFQLTAAFWEGPNILEGLPTKAAQAIC